MNPQGGIGFYTYMRQILWKGEFMKNRKFSKISLTAAFLILIVSITVAFFTSCRDNERLSETDSTSDEVLTTDFSEEKVTQTEPESESETETTEESATKKDLYTIPDEPYYGKKLNPVKFDEDKWYLTFVNKNYVLPEDYKPQLSEELFGTYCQLDVRCAPYYIEMYNAALKEGCYLTPFSGYRRISTQKRNFENEMKIYLNKGYTFDEAYDKAATNILPPATSEHNLGLAMDIVSINHNFDQSKEFKWLMEHAAEYGFILRYPKDKTDITMVQYEPWHWRYVGKEAATEIMSKGITLEEYLGLA